MKRVASFLLAAGLVLVVASPASAAPTSSDPKTAARAPAAWRAGPVNARGFIPSASDATKPDLSLSAQAASAIAAAGVGKQQVEALVAYLGHHVDDVVAHGPIDDPGQLAFLIFDAVAVGDDPTSFGTPATNLVARLVATQQQSGLFGSSDPTYDGAYREGLSLLALHAAGVSNAAGVTWLEGQQCADGSFVGYRANTSVACPAVDPANYVGADTNSTALAVLGLHAQGATTATAKGVAALESVRTAGGGWGYLESAAQPTDANSTAVVLEALRTVKGATDAKGLEALLALQVGCTARPADRGALAFQPADDGKLVPNRLATVQAIPALAGGALPVTAPTIAVGVPVPCAPLTTTTTTVAGPVTTLGSAPPTTAIGVLPRTGSSSLPLTLLALVLAATGLAFVGGSRRRT